MSPRIRWVALVTVVVALGTLAYHVDAAWNTRADAIARQDVAARRLRSMQATRRRAAARLAEARRAREVAGTAHDRAALSVEQHNAELVGTRAAAADAESLRDVKSAEVGIVRQCLAGTGAALDAQQRRDTPGAVAALRLVDGPCRAAAAAGSGPAPRYGFDFPDPFVLTVGTAHYAFATNASGGNIQMLQEHGDGSWTTVGDALGRFPDWAGWGRTWAPSVLARPGGYVMYYTVREAITGRQCVSRAVSPDPGGPYLDASSGPLACGAARRSTRSP